AIGTARNCQFSVVVAAPPPVLPGTPTNFSPVNNETGVSIAKVLTWSATNATTYDVRFGSTNTPPVVSTCQTGTTYDPDLVAGATYFWRITANNAAGSTTGPLLTFTVAPGSPVPPTKATTPSPANHATAVAVTPTLSWTAGTGATARDVYVGTVA